MDPNSIKLTAETLLGSVRDLEEHFFFVLKEPLGKRPVTLDFKLTVVLTPRTDSETTGLVMLLSAASTTKGAESTFCSSSLPWRRLYVSKPGGLTGHKMRNLHHANQRDTCINIILITFPVPSHLQPTKFLYLF